MTSNNLYPAQTARATQTMSFGTHRHCDRPASAVRAGASTMPNGWGSDTPVKPAALSQHGAPARAISDVILDPFRWLTASVPRKVVSGIALLLMVVITFF